MFFKIFLFVTILAMSLTFAAAGVIEKNCTEIIMEDGEEVIKCGDEEVVRDKNGKLQQTIEFDNDTMSVMSYPEDKDHDCYVAWKNNLPEGISYGQIDKEEEPEEADAELSAAVRTLAPGCKDSTIYELKDEPQNNEISSRKKRGCYYYRLCRYYIIRYWSGYRRVIVICWRLYRCYGK